MNAGDVQELYDASIARGDRQTACIALEALEYGVGCDAWLECAHRIAPRVVQRPPRPARMFEHDGQTRTLADWAEVSGIPAETIRNRVLALGWPIERALATPVRHPTR